jgi:large subunit ribosomal protein L21
MYAIAEVAGSQVKFTSGETIRVPKLSLEIGANLTIENFLMAVNDDGTVNVGKPFINGSATATVVDHRRDPKIHLLHKKRRKGFVKQGGHRQHYTMIKIESIAL